MYTFIKRLLSATLICSLLINMIYAETEAQFSPAETEMIETHLDITFAYIPDAVRDAFAHIGAKGCQRSRELCAMLGEDMHISSQDMVVPAVSCAIDMLKTHMGDTRNVDCVKALECLSAYKKDIESGDAIIRIIIEESEDEVVAQTRSCYDSKKDCCEKKKTCCKKKKVKKFCNICAQCISTSTLNVSGNATIGGTLIVDGVDFGPLALIAGTPGLAGAIGAAGADGAPGTIGIPGIPGLGGFLAWGYIYTLTTSGTVAVYVGTNLDPASVPFDSNGPLMGITHTPANTSPTGAVIGIVSTGLYAITFSVSGTGSNQFALFVNGNPSPSTIYGSDAGTQQNTGKTILNLSAGDTLRVVNNVSTAAVGLAQQGGAASNVYASILIVRIA